MIPKNPLIQDNYNVLQQIEQENNLLELQIDRSIGAYFAILLSLSITLYGIYGFIASVTTDDKYIYGALILSGALILFIEKQRTHLLTDYYSSKLEEYVNNDVRKPYIGLLMAIIFTGVFIALDVFGATSVSILIQKEIVQKSVVRSESYKIAQEDSNNIKEQNSISSNAYKLKLEAYKSDMLSYPKSVKEWEDSIKGNNRDCNTQFPTNWITKRDNCKKRFLKANLKPKKPSAPREPSFRKSNLNNDYDKVEKLARVDYQGYDKYMFYAFLFLSFILNYLAVSSVFNQFRAKSKELDSRDMLAIISHRFESMRNMKNNKMENSTIAIEESLKESYIIDVEIEKATYDLSLSNKRNILENRKNVVNNIEYVEAYPSSKTGFINLSKSVNTDKETNGNTNQYIPNIDYTLFDTKEQELISLLFDNGNIPNGKQLVKRDIVLDSIGHNKPNANKLRDLYLRLMELGYIYKKVAYFSKVSVSEALEFIGVKH